MSLRSALRGFVLASVGAAAVLGVAALVSPQVRGRVLAVARRSPEPEPQQPTHIVLPDRAIASWEGLEQAIEEGRAVASDSIALAGA